jgi:hypothetical protein
MILPFRRRTLSLGTPQNAALLRHYTNNLNNLQIIPAFVLHYGKGKFLPFVFYLQNDLIIIVIWKKDRNVEHCWENCT